MKKIDIMRTSASRPEFFKATTEALVERVKFSGKLRWIVHEDCIFEESSDRVMEYIEQSGIYEIYHRDNPPIKQGPSLKWLLDQTKTDYILNFEDDFYLLKEINLDKLIEVMDNNNNINQIGFQKRPLSFHKYSFTVKESQYDGVPLTTNMHWAFTPALWRSSWIKERWITADNSGFNWTLNSHLKGGKTMDQTDASWIEKNMGTYFLGQVKHKRLLKENGGNLIQEEYDNIDNGFYTQHLGMGKSIREGSYADPKVLKYKYEHPNIFVN